eukprot:m.194128 g.194128  ORF g.194128 m.194128 type:complete len:59 (+) comp15199_c0_seq4:5321-5497(+)
MIPLLFDSPEKKRSIHRLSCVNVAEKNSLSSKAVAMFAHGMKIANSLIAHSEETSKIY